MQHDYGKMMAKLHLRFKLCQTPHLNDDECVMLRNWLREMYEYNFEMGHTINSSYFWGEYNRMDQICSERQISFKKLNRFDKLNDTDISFKPVDA